MSDNNSNKVATRKPTIAQRKALFLSELNASLGIVTSATKNAGVSRDAVYRWKKNDKKFSKRWDEITESQVDYVESRLLKNIMAGDTTAIIFYLKTKAKHRGYTEKIEVSANITFGDVLKMHSISTEALDVEAEELDI